MRVPRSALLARWRDAADARAVLLEAPRGFGKSWLLRRLTPRATTIRRHPLGEVGGDAGGDDWLVIDDAHLLTDDEIAELTTLIEDGARRVLVAARLAPERLRRAVQLADGLYLGVADLALNAADIAEAVAANNGTAALTLDDEVVERLLEVTDGEIAVVASTLDELADRATIDLVLVAAQQRRNAVLDTLRDLAPIDCSLVGALARVPMLDRRVLERLGGSDTVRRLVANGVPLQRLPGGLFSLLGAANATASTGFERAVIDRDTARQLAEDLLARGEALHGVTLLLDTGASAEAITALAAMSESEAEGIGPDTLLRVLGRLGTAVDDDPRLLLLRALGNVLLGRDAAGTADTERAARLAESAGLETVARRAYAQLGLRFAFADRREDATAAADRALAGIGTGEEATVARAHMVRATLSQADDSREGLQAAAEEYRVAAAAWDAAGQHVNARFCRSDLAMAALCPLGRHDEALAVIAELLAVADLSDAERSWYLLNEGFALFQANRLDRASARFSRVIDLARVQHNPRLAAAGAWGRAMVAAKLGDLGETLRWLTQAENTALGDDDNALGVPFLVDASMALGALGADDLARRYFDRAEAGQGIYYAFVDRARFFVNAREGLIGDRDAVEEHLASTPPADWWRVLLVAADAAARGGDRTLAAEWLRRAEYELLGLGLSDFEAAGEGRTYRRLRQALDAVTDDEAAATGDAAAPARPGGVAAPPPSPSGLRVCVFGSTMTVVGAHHVEVPPGNPQRLAGVVVANGGVATFDQVSDALWPGEELTTTRPRLRNVLMRLRKAVGNVVVRTPNGVRLAPGVTCDLLEFDQLASDALTYLRSDPDLAGRLASEGIELAGGPLFSDFEYDEWALTVRRRTEQQLLTLLDLLSVQAQDAGDLGRALQLAERALRLDRYTDSRYVRLADLLALDGRAAAAIAVLAEANDVAGELGTTVSDEVRRRRTELGDGRQTR